MSATGRASRRFVDYANTPRIAQRFTQKDTAPVIPERWRKPLILGAFVLNFVLVGWLLNLQEWRGMADWRIWAELDPLNPYTTRADGWMPFRYSPVAGWLLHWASVVGPIGFIVGHFAVLLLLPRKLGLIVAVSFPFWMDLLWGNVFTLVFVAAWWALRSGSDSLDVGGAPQHSFLDFEVARGSRTGVEPASPMPLPERVSVPVVVHQPPFGGMGHVAPMVGLRRFEGRVNTPKNAVGIQAVVQQVNVFIVHWPIIRHQIGVLAYIALTLLMPRPVQLPLLAWLLWKEPWVRVPFVALFLGHAGLVLLSGVGQEWVTALVSSASESNMASNFGGSRLFAGWLVIGVPLSLYLFLRGRPAWAGLALSPYLLGQYWLFALIRPGSAGRTSESR
jgi:hypothetical protein